MSPRQAAMMGLRVGQCAAETTGLSFMLSRRVSTKISVEPGQRQARQQY